MNFVLQMCNIAFNIAINSDYFLTYIEMKIEEAV